MARNHVWRILLSRGTLIVFLLLLFSSCGAYLFYQLKCIDGCGPYQNRASVADLDEDGDLDVILWNRRHETENIIWQGSTLWTNLGGGHFTSSGLALPEMEPVAYFDGVAGDVDGDGSQDITMLTFNDLRFFLNRGGDAGRGGEPGWAAGTFRFRDSAVLRGDAGISDAVLFGDLDQDGDLDAFVPGCCRMVTESYPKGKKTYTPSYSWVWLNSKDQAGRLEDRSVILKEFGDLPVKAAALGDLNGDGSLDVYAAIPSATVGDPYDVADRVLLNDGSGAFTDSGQRLAASVGLAGNQAGSTAVALGDLDRDGDLDALVGKTSGTVIWINQGGAQGGQAGSFRLADQMIPGAQTEAVFLSDLDGDGDLDAVVAGKNQASIWWNDGQAAFHDSGQRLRYTEQHGLAVADFTGDGSPDVFSAAYGTRFHLWQNQGNGELKEKK